MPEQRTAPGLPDLPPAAAPQRTIHLIGNAHIDPVWLWPWQEGYAEARATFASAIERMDEYDDFVFTCDQIVLLSWVKESDPVLFARIADRVAEGRWVNVGGWWVEPDCNAPMGESFVRHGLYGQRFLQAEFGKMATVGMNVDPFGHNAMIPAILRGQGMDSYTFLRPGPHEADLYDIPFWWQAPDGSRVLASRIPFEYCSSGGDLSHQTEKALGQLDRSRSTLMVFYGVGNHGGGPTRANIDSIHHYHRLGTFGQLIMSSPREFFDQVGAEPSEQVPTWTGDLQHHAAGCYSAHSQIKADQRRAQYAVLSAERWAVIGDLLAGQENPALAYPVDDLERAWKQVLFNQFHDVLPGSAIASAYDDARDQLGEAIAISKRIITRAQNVIARQLDIPADPDSQPVVIFNPHPWPVRATMEINYRGQPDGAHLTAADGTPVPTQRIQPRATISDSGHGALLFPASLPALGYRLFRISPGQPGSEGGRPGPEHARAEPDSAQAEPDSAQAEPNSAQAEPDSAPAEPGHELRAEVAADGRVVCDNEHLHIEIDPRTGWLASLLDRRTGIDLAGQGEHLQICADPTDTWGHRVVSYAWPGETMPVSRVRLVENGPVRVSVAVERSWGRSTMTETFRLTSDSDAVELSVDLDWRERAHLLKMRFPVAIDNPQATFEIPYATLQRPVDGAEEPAQSWVDLTGRTEAGPAGLVVINNAKHGYDASPADSPLEGADPSIGITAVRSPVYAWHNPQVLDPDADYVYQDQGRQRFSCLLVPHAGDWRTARPSRRAAELGARPRAMLESFHPGTLPAQQSFVEVIAIDGDGQVMATAVKGAEDGDPDRPRDLIIRLSETVGFAAEVEVRLPIVGRTLNCRLEPYQLRTFRIPSDRQRRISETDLIETDLIGTDLIDTDLIRTGTLPCQGFS